MLKCYVICLALLLLSSQPAQGGGGVVMEGAQCTMHIDFYSARFTAYQPETSGNHEFCEDLPETGLTLFVLDYLHPSLKEVPVDFRIIRNETDQGPFATWEHVEKLGNLQALTLFYQSPRIESDASLNLEYVFSEPGEYIGIVLISALLVTLFFGGWQGPWLPPIVWFAANCSSDS